MAVTLSAQKKLGTCYANGARTNSTPGAMTLEIRTDAGPLHYTVPWGSHNGAAYAAATVALVLMDAQGYHVVRVETPNRVMVDHMMNGRNIGPAHLVDSWDMLRHVCQRFDDVRFIKV